MCVMSQCKKFVPNIFHKTKCSNCFRQKEEHTAEALECNRASRSIARSGYLFVAPDWDFSVPLNRTKRWQRRWFVLYDDGELNYSVDEHPDTVPQGSVDMSKVLEVTGAEQITGHPHSLALTGPDRVTFVKAASREDARWWAELLAVFPRRHKRNATFPGGRASPSLPQLGRSASPQPQRPRHHLSCGVVVTVGPSAGPNPRTNFTTPPLREEREPTKEATTTDATTDVESDAVVKATTTASSRPTWFPKPTSTVPIESVPRTDYHLLSSGSPPTRDKLKYDEANRRSRSNDWRHERLRDIATDIITDRSPESSLALPAEGLLNLKKGWLWYKIDDEWCKRWWVLCGPALNGYRDQDEHVVAEVTVELSSVTGCAPIETDFKYGFRIDCAPQPIVLSAVTAGIRSNWLHALKKAAAAVAAAAASSSSSFSASSCYGDTKDEPASPPRPALEQQSIVTTVLTPRSLFLSSDEEYRTASEGGRRDSEDWSEIPSSPPPPQSLHARRLMREKNRMRPKLPKSSRHSTVDSVSTDELDACREPDEEEEEADEEEEDELNKSCGSTKGNGNPATTTRKYQEKMLRTRPKMNRCQSRHSTLDSVSTDELVEASRDPEIEFRNVVNKQALEIANLKRKCVNAEAEIQNLEVEISRLKKAHNDLTARDKQLNEMLELYEINDTATKMELKMIEEKHAETESELQRKLAEAQSMARDRLEAMQTLQNELKTKELLLNGVQATLTASGENLANVRQENERLYKKLQEMSTYRSNTPIGNNNNSNKRIDSLQDLTDIDCDLNVDTMTRDELIDAFVDLRDRFERAVIEIRAVKRELRESYVKYDDLELENAAVKRNVRIVEEEARAQSALMANRVQDLANKLTTAERQARSLKAKLQHSRGKRRSLSLKGKENFSVNKEVEDKVNELEAKILALEKSRTRRKRRDRSAEQRPTSASPSGGRIPNERCPVPRQSSRRKSLDSATTSEPMKLLMRLSSLEHKVTNVAASNESLNLSGCNASNVDDCHGKSSRLTCDRKLKECLDHVDATRRRLIDDHDDGRVAPSLDDLLNRLERSLNECRVTLTCDRNDETEAYETSAGDVVRELTSLLNEKLSDINERRRKLRDANDYDDRKRMQLIAEKMAYEAVIVDRLRRAMETTPADASESSSTTACDRYVYKEIVETINLMNELHDKLSGKKRSRDVTYRTTADHLTATLTERLVLSNSGNANKLKPFNNTKPYAAVLVQERDRLETSVTAYKSKCLSRLADALANEALALSADATCRLTQANDAIWRRARETVNAELIQAEIDHVLAKIGRVYATESSRDLRWFFAFYASERATLELWTETVEDHLNDEIERGARELNDLFHVNLSKLRQRQNWRRRVENERCTKSMDLLHEYADVIAHKALIDARLHAIIDGEEIDGSTRDRHDHGTIANLLRNDTALERLESDDLLIVESPLEAEFKCMYETSKRDCLQEVIDVEMHRFQRSLAAVAEEIAELETLINGERSATTTTAADNSNDPNETCSKLRDALQAIRNSLNKATRYEEDSLLLGAEYLNHVENLRLSYRRVLAECAHDKQKRHDVEQLQLLCERVLIAMDRWHRKTLRDVREQHAQEMEMLREDKEQALAEETQATLAALDAMRKAHEADVKREVAKFKEDFQRKQQTSLLQLSERLSVKCLETAALEEQLGTAGQLAHAQQHILQLERNPQFSSMQN